MKGILLRFLDKVEFPKDTVNDCWIWKGARTRGDYGHLRVKKNNKWSMRRAHILSYELYVGIVEEGLCICHKCDNRLCVNPNHLFKGTFQDNIDDKMRKGRHGWGIKDGFRKLSLEIANKIRVMKQENNDLIYKEIGEIFSTSTQQVCRIINNQIWKNPEGGL